MGQNSPENIESRSIYVHNWLPLQHQPHVFVNKITLQQVQRHSLHLSLNNLTRQVAIHTGRINNHQPYICRLLYLHPLSQQNTRAILAASQKEFYFYTDRLFPIQQWSYDKIIMILHGYRKLLILYGPIKINENMIGQTYSGQIKVWISENATSIEPDLKYAREEDSARDLIQIIYKNNYQIAKICEKSGSLREMIQKLNRQRRESNNSFNSPSNQAYKPEITDSLKNKSQLKPQVSDSLKSKPELKERIVSKNSYKNPFVESMPSYLPPYKLKTESSPIKIQKYTFTPFNLRSQEMKPTSNPSNTLDYNNRDREEKQKALMTPNQHKISSNSIYKSKSNNEMFLQFKKTKESDIENKSTYSSIKNKQKHGYKPSETPVQEHFPTSHQGKSPQKPYHFNPKLQNKAAFNHNLAKVSDKSKTTQGTRKQDAKNIQQKSFGQTGHHKSPLKTTPTIKKKSSEQQKNYVSENITIINNNVNNYINNITHNHIVKIEKTSQPIQFNQFKPKNPGENPSNHSSQISKNFRDKTYIPGFITQKKHQPGFFQEESPFNAGIKPKTAFQMQANASDNLLLKPQNMSPKPPSNNFNKSFKKQQEEEIANKSKYSQKTDAKRYQMQPKPVEVNKSKHSFDYPEYNIPKTPQIKHIYDYNDHSKLQPHQYHNSTNTNTNYQFKVPFRTKTTEFFQKNKDTNKKSQFCKSFTQKQAVNPKKTTIFEQIQKTSDTPIPEKQIEKPPTKENKHAEIKNQMKNILSDNQREVTDSKKKLSSQLKNEFKFLLFDSNVNEPEQTQCSAIQKSKSSSNVVKQVKQMIQVKDKIKKKQIVFAQLKKQANTLLN